MQVTVHDDEYVRYTGNIINISRRHCRIGRVRLKKPRHWNDRVPQAGPWFPNPDLPAPYWSGGYAPVTSSADVPLVPSHGVCM